MGKLKHISSSNLKELEDEFNKLKNVEIVSININGMKYILHYLEKKNGRTMERRKSKSS